MSTNLGEVLVMFLGVAAAGLLGVIAGSGEALVLPLLVTMILRINLVTDSFPALAVGVDPADPELMHRAPRDPRAALSHRGMWYGIGMAAAVMCIGTLLVLDAGVLVLGLEPVGHGDGPCEAVRCIGWLQAVH